MKWLARISLITFALVGLYVGYLVVATHLALRQPEAKAFSENDLENPLVQQSYQNCLGFPNEVKDSKGVVLTTQERFCLCYAVNEIDYLDRGLIQVEEIRIGQDGPRELLFQVAQTCRRFFQPH